MKLDEYQEVAEKTAVYPDAGEGTLRALVYTTLGLAGEAGELANKVKKLLRDKGLDMGELVEANLDHGPFDELACELGDVLWYVAQTATELNLCLSKVAELNIARLSDRATRGALHGSGDKR